MTPPDSRAQNEELQRLLLAARSLSKTVEKQVITNMIEGMSAMAERNYRALHQRIASLLPDDFYITTVLVLEDSPGEQDDQVRMAQLNMLCAQLVDYLSQLLKPRAMPLTGDPEDWRGVGRELQDQIMQMTRKTIRRALQNIDFTMPPEPPEPPEPPFPPGTPGVPGSRGRRRIHIEFGTDAPPGGWERDEDEDDDKPKNV